MSGDNPSTIPPLLAPLSHMLAMPAFQSTEAEREFWEQDDDRKHLFRFFALVAGVLIFTGFAFADVRLAGEASRDMLTARFATSAIALAIALVFLTNQTPRVREALICLFGWTILIGNIWITAVSDRPAADILPFCIPVFAAFGTVILVPRFRTLALFMAISLMIFLATLPLTPSSAEVKALNTVFVVLSISACLIAVFARERFERSEAINRLRLEALSREAIAANEAKDALLANVSHELRTPVNAILGFSEVIGKGIFGEIQPAKYREYVDDIHFSAALLKTGIDDLLDLSRLQLDKLNWDPRPCSLARILAKSVAICRSQAEEAGIALLYRPERQDSVIMADPDRMTQAFVNIVMNAVKFSQPGADVRIGAYRDVSGYVIEVADDGCGIAAEDIQRVREPFGQADDRRYSAGKGGLGLGLPIAIGFIEILGGRLEIDSRLGAGTVVRIVLPQDILQTSDAGRHRTEHERIELERSA